jgi:chromosome segregation ATPase
LDGEGTEREEISRMKHSLRVLEGTLQVEKKLAQEYYTELCTKIQEHEDLKKDYCQLERKLDCLQGMKDLQEELDHTANKLDVAEKTLTTYEAKVHSLEEYKEKAEDMETKLRILQSQVSSAEEYRMVSWCGTIQCFVS